MKHAHPRRRLLNLCAVVFAFAFALGMLLASPPRHAEAAAPTAVAFTAGTLAANNVTSWTATFTSTGAGALAAGGTITVQFHASFIVPASPAITLAPAFANCVGTGVGVGTTVTITLASTADAHGYDGQPWDRAPRAGYAWAGFAENVATMSTTAQPAELITAQTTVNGWMNSPPHRANILTGAYTETGVGCAAGRPASPRNNLEFVILCVAVYGTPK